MKKSHVWETVWGLLAAVSYIISTITYVFLDNTQDAIYFMLMAILCTLFENQARGEQ